MTKELKKMIKTILRWWRNRKPRIKAGSYIKPTRLTTSKVRPCVVLNPDYEMAERQYEDSINAQVHDLGLEDSPNESISRIIA